MVDRDVTQILRGLPAVEQVLQLVGPGPRAAATTRAVLEQLRREIQAGRQEGPVTDVATIAARVRALLAANEHLAYPRLVNATGIFLHTGLGRSPLAAPVAEALAGAAAGFCQLEVDAGSGQRDQRESRVMDDLLALTGAEAGTVVNNNAGAVLLAMRALAAGREVVVSRGELVEIGGGFRLPDVMALSGARLVEVGTTNRTYARDYEKALGPETALVLRVHTSNYRVVGFQHTPERGELVAVATRAGVPLLEDIGSGLLGPGERPPALAAEPDATTALAEGADLVCFSGDKLLGGPQAGILVGRRGLVAKCRDDPLFRALRPDRLCLAALAGTLRLHREAPGEVPVVAALSCSPRARLERARRLAARLSAVFDQARFEAIMTEGQVGSGSAPARGVKTAAVEVHWPGLEAAELSARLRGTSPPIMGRLYRGTLRLDVLALLPGDEDRIELAFKVLP